MYYVLVYCRRVFNTSTYFVPIVHTQNARSTKTSYYIVVYELIFCFHYIHGVPHYNIWLCFVPILWCDTWITLSHKKQLQQNQSDSLMSDNAMRWISLRMQKKMIKGKCINKKISIDFRNKKYNISFKTMKSNWNEKIASYFTNWKFHKDVQSGAEFMS